LTSDDAVIMMIIDMMVAMPTIYDTLMVVMMIMITVIVTPTMDSNIIHQKLPTGPRIRAYR